MSTQSEKIKLDDLLNKITDQEKREQLKEEFIKLQKLRIGQPERMLTEFKKAKENHENKIQEFENKIKDIEGTIIEGEDGKRVKTGLLLLRQQLDKTEEPTEKEKLRLKIVEQEKAKVDLDKSLKESRERHIEVNKNFDIANSLALQLKTQTELLQSKLNALGFNNPLLHKVENIDCSTLNQTLSSSQPDTSKENRNPQLPHFTSQSRTWGQKEQGKQAKIGYLSKPEPLTTNLTNKGYNAMQLTNPPPASWTVQIANNNTVKIENHEVSCSANKNDRKTLLAMVEIFEECERNKFIAQGNDPKDFDKSKIIPKATGEASAEVLKICEEKGIGTFYKKQQKPSSPTNLSGDNNPNPSTPPKRNDEPPPRTPHTP